MKKLISATLENGEKVYGKLIGVYELIIDTSGPYVPGWMPDCEILCWDCMKTITGEMFAVDVNLKGKLIAHEPQEDYRFYEGYGIIAATEYGTRKSKRGRLSNSRNKKAERIRKDNMLLDEIFGPYKQKEA